jgi:hypothetical protein
MVTLFEVVEEGIYAAWNGADYGQPNPQNSSSDGSYSFSAPAGLYRIYAAHEGYQAYRSDDLDIVDLVNEVISLSPSIAQTPDVVIAISESGFSPAILDVKPGSVIEFVNVGGAEHRIQSGANWDSGILLSGERYKVVAGDVGVISVSDGLSAANVAQITIDPLAGQWQIFLPTMQR